MASSIEHLSKHLSLCITVRRGQVSLYAPTCLALICYTTKFNSNLSDIIRRLDDLAAYILKQRPPRIDRKKVDDLAELFVNSFVPQAQEFFKVPKVHHLSEKDKALKKNEILAGFMDFLLQILNSEASRSRDVKQRYAILQKELTYLLTFLGDVPFQCTDLEEVKNLLTEFETVANEAGSLIYSCIFEVPLVEASSFDASEQALLEKVELLNEMIKEHYRKLPELPICCGTPRTRAVDSLFIVDSLLEDLQNMINGQFNLPIDDIKDQIKIVHEELTSSRTLLNDIKLPHNTDMDDQVHESFIKVRDVAYEAEYLINSHVMGNVPLWYTSLRLPAIIHEMNIIAIGLQETKRIYDAKGVQVAKDFSGELSSQKAQPTVAVDNLVVGFEDNRERILEDLIEGSEELKFISIFGMPGLGKTTIANKLYNDQSIYDHFDLRARCVISQTYRKRNILIEILTSMGRKPEEVKIPKMEDKDLGLEIYQSLKGQRYLIMMDDVWHSDLWYDLRRYFPDDSNGSRIMLTSRIKDVAPKNSIFHTVPLLSEVQCWDLLAKKVFRNEPCPRQFLDIGKCIAAKCNGLPLAVVVIAGILGNLEKKESVWEKVEKNLDSYIMDDESKCMKILELSYKHLPNHLRACFLYLGAFPEDTLIPTRILTWLWIAEGFIKKAEDQSPEDVAEQFLADLINRSLLQAEGIRSDGGIKACRIHDVLRDMCLKRADEENFLKSIKDHSSIYENHHHLSDYSTSSTRWRDFGLHCRSISGHFSDPSSRFPQMPLLRVMDLLSISDGFCYLTNLDLLVHLRYLGIDEMPGPLVANLVNLEFLCVGNESNRLMLDKIPSVIFKMVKLRHLCIKAGANFEEGLDLYQTTNLMSLSYVRIYNQKDVEIWRRICSPHLRKLKCICKEAVFPDLRSSTELQSLKIVFEFGRFNGELAKINFPSTIRKLTLCKIGLPWEEMSVVGILPNLHVLKLLDHAFVGKEWKTRDGEFQELRLLKLDSFSLKQWITESEHFPKLECLVLQRCWQELEIPSEVGNIPTLRMIELRVCSQETAASAARIEKEQLEYGNEELEVIIENNVDSGLRRRSLQN